MNSDAKQILGGDIKESFTFLAQTLGFISFVYVVVNTAFRDTIPPVAILAVAIFAGFCFAALRLQLTIAASTEHRFQVVDEDKGGAILTDHVRAAKVSIHATCFTTETPSEGYVGTLLDKLREEVRIRRVVYYHPGRDSYAWLKRFAAFRECYTQYAVPIRLPFNVVVVDRKLVWVFFPRARGEFFRTGVWFRDSEVAKLFADAIETLATEVGVECDHTRLDEDPRIPPASAQPNGLKPLAFDTGGPGSNGGK